MAVLLKKTLSGFIFLGMGVALVLGIVFRIDVSQIWEAISRFSIGSFSIILALTFIAILVGILRGRFIFKAQGDDIALWKLFVTAGVAFNYLIPFGYVGGEGAKGYVLNRRFKVPWPKVASYLALDKLFELTGAFFVIFAAMIAFVHYLGFSGLTKRMFFAIGFILAVTLLFAMFYLVLFKKKKIFTNLLNFLKLKDTRFGRGLIGAENDIIDFFDVRSKYMWGAWFLTLLRQVIQIFRHILIIFYLGRGLLFAAPIISLGGLYLGYTIPIPGALGIQEVFQGILFSIFGWGAGEGLAVSFILRGVDAFVVAIGVMVLFRYGIKLTMRTKVEVIDTKDNN